MNDEVILAPGELLRNIWKPTMPKATGGFLACSRRSSSPRAIAATANAIGKAQFLVEEIERRLQ